MEIDDKKLLKEQERELEDAIAFFSNDNKKERELIVVRYFLSNLNISFNEEELVTITDEPPDVKFREANFEVKEIMNKNRFRHAEYKKALEKCRTATKISNMFEISSLDELTFQDVVIKVNDFLSEYREVYSREIMQNLDLLFYFNLVDYHFTGDNTYTLPDEIPKYGLRSISVTKFNMGCVLYASSTAPDLIKNLAGKVFVKSG